MKKLLRRAALLCGSALFFACGSPKPEGPSLILVVVDTLRADYLGCYGFQGASSPNLDRLAEEGLLYERCFAQAPWTKPSVATLLTSLHPRAHGVLTHHGWFGERTGEDPSNLHASGETDNASGQPSASTDVLPQEAHTLAEALRRRGYRTAAFVANPWIRPEWGFDQGFELFEHYEEQDATRPIREANQWLEKVGDAPSFVFLHLMDVHGPYQAPEEDYRALLDSPSLRYSWKLDDPAFERIPAYLRHSPWTQDAEARDLKTWRTRYAAGVRAVDEKIGGLVQYLELTERLDKTVLIVTADHGEELLEHNGWDHGRNLYDHQTHVPWIVRLPEKRHAGTHLGEVCSLTDVMPSALAWLEVASPPGIHGSDRSDPAREPEPFAMSIAEGVKWRPQVFSLRTEGYKLVADFKRKHFSLFHLQTDPAEQRDVAPREPETVRLLLKELERHIERTSKGALSKEQASISDQLQQQLNALGYQGEDE